MKNLLVLLLVSFSAMIISATAFGGGKTPPPSDGYGTPRCAAYDDGNTEEHGSHFTCEECRRHHPGCEMRCYRYDYTCKVSADVPNGNGGTIRRDFTGQGQSRNMAMDNAIYQCRASGAWNCMTSTCNEDAVLYNSSRCY